MAGIPGANAAYRSQIGPTVAIGGGISKRLSKLFSADVTVQGSLLSGSVISDEFTVLSINDSPVPATIRHTIDLSLYAVGIEPSIRLFLDQFRLRIGIPIQFLLRNTYIAKQEVVNPPGVFLGGQAIRVEGEGELPGAQTVVPAVSVGVGTAGKVVGSIRIAPEVTLRVPISSISAVADWKIWSLSAGVRIAPSFDKIKPIRRDTLWIRDTMVLEVATSSPRSTSTRMFAVDSVDEDGEDVTMRHVAARERTTISVPHEPLFIRAEARAMFVDQQGIERDRITIRTVRYDNEFLMPLMSTVYFSPRSSDLASYDTRNVLLPKAWEETPLARRIATMQYRLLDDWALEIARSTSVSIRGRASASEPASLADARTQVVVNYLVEHGAERSRIRVLDSEILDDSSSNARTVSVDPGKVLTAMQREQWTAVQPEACAIRIHLRAEGDAPVRSWEVRFSTSSGLIGSIDGQGEMPESVLFTVPDSVTIAMGTGSEISYRVLVRGDENTLFTSEPARISMQQASSDKSARTKRYMAVPTTEVRSAHDAAFYTLKWGKTQIQELTNEDLEMLHGLGVTWARILRGMVLVRADQ
ncbi:hypothetical protein BH10BAC6_BH10BAC6_18330 [soil metagenome]